MLTVWCLHNLLYFLRAKAATAFSELSHRNSVCFCHTGGSVKKRCKLGLLNLHRRLPGRSSFRNHKAFP